MPTNGKGAEAIVEIFPAKGKWKGKWCWRMILRGKIIAIGKEPFATPSSARRSVRGIARGTASAAAFSKPSKGDFSWLLSARNGKGLAYSPAPFKTMKACRNCFDKFILNAKDGTFEFRRVEK